MTREKTLLATSSGRGQHPVRGGVARAEDADPLPRRSLSRCPRPRTERTARRPDLDGHRRCRPGPIRLEGRPRASSTGGDAPARHRAGRSGHRPIRECVGLHPSVPNGDEPSPGRDAGVGRRSGRAVRGDGGRPPHRDQGRPRGAASSGFVVATRRRHRLVARQVVFNLPIDLAAALLGRQLDGVLGRRETQSRAAWSAFTGYLAIRRSVVADDGPLFHQVLQSYDRPIHDGNNVLISLSPPGTTATVRPTPASPRSRPTRAPTAGTASTDRPTKRRSSIIKIACWPPCDERFQKPRKISSTPSSPPPAASSATRGGPREPSAGRPCRGPTATSSRSAPTCSVRGYGSWGTRCSRAGDDGRGAVGEAGCGADRRHVESCFGEPMNRVRVDPKSAILGRRPTLPSPSSP